MVPISVPDKTTSCWRCFLRFIILSLLILIASGIIIVGYCDYGSRARFAEAMNYAKSVERVIESNAGKAGTFVGSGQKIDLSILNKPDLFQYVHVTDDGTIIFKLIKYKQVSVLVPEFENKQVVWKCVGAPERDVGTECR